MKTKRMVMPVMIAVLLAVIGCTTERGDQSSTPRQAARADVDWSNNSGGYLQINNNIKQPLILFAGSVNNTNILGGIRAESSRRIDYFKAVQDQAGSFLLRAVPEDVYRSKGSRISSEDVVYASIVTFDKRQPKITQLNIDVRLGGRAYVIIENYTRMALEIALDSPNAETLTALGPMEMNRRIYLEPSTEGYVFYPIFKYYDRTNDVIQSVEPDRAVARLMNPAIPSATVSTPAIKFDNTNIGTLTFRFATIIVRNEGIEAIRLLEGSSRVMNQNRTNIVNPGTETYNIYLGDRAQRRTYSIEYGGEDYPLRTMEYVPGNTYQVIFRRDGTRELNDLGEFDKKELSINLLNQR